MSARKPITIGSKYGRLTILAELPAIKADRSRRVVLCRCDCGKEKRIRLDHLTRSGSQSCGCLMRERVSSTKRRHGHTRISGSDKVSSEYKSWLAMIGRCTNPKDHAFHNYGGRGITVCPEWRHSFEQFFQDMGPKNAPGLTIERIKNSKGYSPENCVWATKSQQGKNTRRVKKVTFGGETFIVSEWAARLGVKHRTLFHRIFIQKMPLSRALSPGLLR